LTVFGLVGDKVVDLADQFFSAAKRAAPDGLISDQAEEALRQIHEL